MAWPEVSLIKLSMVETMMARFVQLSTHRYFEFYMLTFALKKRGPTAPLED